MTQVKRTSSWIALLVALGMVLTLTTAPGGVRAADHLDAPGFLESPGDDPRLDINDVLVFEGETGLFTPNAGEAVVVVSEVAPGLTIGLTVEPEGGSAVPTSDVLLQAELGA